MTSQCRKFSWRLSPMNSCGLLATDRNSCYEDVVTDEMNPAISKVAQLAFPSNGARTERKGS